LTLRIALVYCPEGLTKTSSLEQQDHGMEPQHLLGASCALSAAVVWAFAVVLFKQSGEKFPPLALNLFKNVVAMVLLVLSLIFVGEGFETLEVYSPWDVWILIFSGFLGVTLADTLFFYSLNLIGVGLSSIVDCLYSPLVIFFSLLLLSESLIWPQYLGAGLIVFAVFITTRHTPPPGKTRLHLIIGISLGVLSKGLMAIGIVIAKPVLTETPLVWSTTIRLASATATLALVVMILPQRRALLEIFRPSKEWKKTIPGSVLGAYLALVLWIAGFKYTFASLAGILNQTTTIFSMVLAALILKEAFTRRKFAALVFALGGILLVILYQQ
jgi:drug/metabolite transporter (DMT)-like permease